MTTTRQSDDPVIAERIKEVRREGRKRTIIYSVIASGIVSLFIGHAIEVGSTNAQIERSRVNCGNFHQIITVAVLDPLHRQADNVLGNPKKHIEPFVLKGTSFEKFAPLIRAQAQQARRDASAITPLLAENCNKTFPKRNPVPFLK